LPTQTVSDYLRDSPFRIYAGALSKHTGEEDFVQLQIHDELRRTIEAGFFQKIPVTVRILVSGIGGGKTWALSSLYRNFSAFDDTFVDAVPRLELRGVPERGLVEAIFRGLRPSIEDIRTRMRSREKMFPIGLTGTATHYVWLALLEESVYALLCGGGARLPQLGGLNAPPLTKYEGNLQLLLGLFRILNAIGYVKILVLIDEVESLFVAYGRKDLIIFSNLLRDMFDEFQADDGDTLPRLVMILAGTSSVLERISPGLVGRISDESDVATGLLRRLAPVFPLIVEDPLDALRIASFRIGRHRKQRSSKPYIPYEEDAVLYVWKNSYNNLGDFCLALQYMYEFALSESAQRITLELAQRAIAQLHRRSTLAPSTLGETPEGTPS
jgi:hypothetical protein